MSRDASGDWLFVIDVQPAFSDPVSPWYCAALGSAKENIARLLPRYEGRVLFSRFVPPPEGLSSPCPASSDWFQLWPPKRLLKPSCFVHASTFLDLVLSGARRWWSRHKVMASVKKKFTKAIY